MKEKTYTVYVHKNKINNHCYVGVTSLKPEYRWGKEGNGYKTQRFYYAIKKYGWNNFDHIILEENIPKTEINSKEKYYINLYDSKNNGYNCTIGGLDEIPFKIFGTFLITENEIKKINQSYKMKPVICVNTGEIFKSVTEAGKKYHKSPSSIGRMCKDETTRSTTLDSSGRYIFFRYYNPDNIYNLDELRIKDSKQPIICITTGNIYCSIAEASKVTGLLDTQILASCKGVPGGSSQLQFRYYSDYIKNGINKNFIDKRCHKVILVNTGEIFDTIKEAGKKYNTSPNCIERCCTNRSKSTLSTQGDNLVWQYYEDYLINPKNVSTGSKRKIIPVHCITTNLYFKNATMAGNYYHIDRHDISECCKGIREYVGYDNQGNKLLWEYYIP